VARNDHIIRTLKLLQALQSRPQGITLNELSELLDKGVRTVRRDLDALKEAGYQLDFCVGRNNEKQWMLAPEARRRFLVFNPDEAASLYLGAKLAGALSGSFLGEAANDALSKARTLMNEPASQAFSQFPAILHVKLGAHAACSAHAENLAALFSACEDWRVVRMSYRPAGAAEPIRAEICPYALVLHYGAVYVIGFADYCHDMRTFKLNRFLKAAATNRRFDRDPHFDVSRYIDDALGMFGSDGRQTIRARVRVSGPFVDIVQEQVWHPSQQVTLQPDGAAVFSFELGDCTELKHWVYGLGPFGELLEPTDVREEMRRELEMMLNLHADRE